MNKQEFCHKHGINPMHPHSDIYYKMWIEELPEYSVGELAKLKGGAAEENPESSIIYGLELIVVIVILFGSILYALL